MLVAAVAAADGLESALGFRLPRHGRLDLR